ncbi:MAG: tetratricopeptide repeat protein, partial [Planctomycetaceae bacterium]|nr:tetratricopeptide repeat protein [Planctomycetaceae bacterium]
TYIRAGMSAYSTGQWEPAKLYLERALELGASDRDLMFSLARAAEATQDKARVVAILQKLAPEGRPVYAPAHFWMATQILNSGTVDRAEIRKAETHLKHILQLNPGHTAAHGLLGDIYFQLGHWEAAARHLEQSNSGSPKYRLLLAKACLNAGDKTRAERYARDGLKLAKEKCDSDPYDADSRLLWAEATALLEQFEQAVSILAAGLRQQDTWLLRVAMTRVYIHWADSVEGLSEDDQRRRFGLLAEAMKYNPNETALFDRLMKILNEGGGASEDTKQFLLKSIAEKRAVGISHLILGTAAWTGGDKAEAGVHLERAFAELPDALAVANNFSWFLVNKAQSEPERALELISPMAERFPENHFVRDTRGHILLKLGRWKDAVDDLEFAVRGLPDNRQTHLSLASAYRNLGLTDLADAYQQAAERIPE